MPSQQPAASLSFTHPSNPHGPENEIQKYCLGMLEKAVRVTQSGTGCLALLDDDGLTAAQVFTQKSKQKGRLAPPKLDPVWAAAIQAGIAHTIANFNPFKRCVVVPFYSADKPVLAYILAGRLWRYTAEDIAQIATIGKDTWGGLEHIRYISQLEQAYEMTMQNWARSIEERERPVVSGYYKLAAEWSVELGRALRIPENLLQPLWRGALLHDIGKMSIPDHVLRKPGDLTPDEWTLLRRHPLTGAEMVANTLILSGARDVILYHHERWDGKGYPHGLKGDEIPLLARIFSVVDVFDALIVDRPYSPAWPRDMALAYIRQEAGHQFDPVVVESFLAIAKSLRIE